MKELFAKRPLAWVSGIKAGVSRPTQPLVMATVMEDRSEPMIEDRSEPSSITVAITNGGAN